jgi:murein DD-endopeptidase MepM/ murein hydrolase activator NlpD
MQTTAPPGKPSSAPDAAPAAAVLRVRGLQFGTIAALMGLWLAIGRPPVGAPTVPAPDAPAGSAVTGGAVAAGAHGQAALTPVAPIEASLGLATIEVIVGSNDTLDRIFRKLKISLSDLATMRAMPGLRSGLDRLYPGETLKFILRGADLFALERRVSPSETLKVRRETDGFATDMISNPLEIERQTTSGTITSSLFQAANAAGIEDTTALAIADIFAWDIDFVLDIQPGDSFRVTFEKVSQDGRYLHDGRILAVQFVNRGRVYQAVRYEHADGTYAYFTPDGRSLRKAFIRAPVEFTRISSRFNGARLHPILNTIRAHKGVDYAAPVGTPVRAAGDGRVVFAGRRGGYGNVIELAHANQVSTVYGHLSRFARGLAAGNRVQQGSVIGFVGMTGLATGPHLHYEYRVRGQQKDPQKVPLPSSEPIPAIQMADFRASTAPLLVSLAPAADGAPRASTAAAAPSSVISSSVIPSAAAANARSTVTASR